MEVTAEAARGWRGRDVLDAEGERVGVLADSAGDLVDASGGVRWLAVELVEAAGEVVLAPTDGAEPTGTAVRLAALAATVRSAPPVVGGAAGRVTPDEDRALALHYQQARPSGRRPG